MDLREDEESREVSREIEGEPSELKIQGCNERDEGFRARGR